MVYKSGQIFLPFCHNPRVWQTDGQTDGQTKISSQYRVCITCSAVKTKNKGYYAIQGHRSRYQSKARMWLPISDIVQILNTLCFWPPCGGLGTTYDVHLGLTEKRVVDSLLVLTELSSLGVTAEALRVKTDRKSAISLQRGRFDPKFQVEGVATHQSFLHR